MSPSPYSDLPQHCFWRHAVQGQAQEQFDPLVSTPFTISRTDQVATAGSCFAQHIARHLRSAGLHFLLTEAPHPLLSPQEAADYQYGTYTARYGNVYTTRQLLQLAQRAYGHFSPQEDLWLENGRFIDPFRPRIQPAGFASRAEYQADRTQHFAAVREAFETLDVFVFTLGLTEAWASVADGAVFPLCPGVTGGRFDAARHRLHNFSVGEVVDDALAFIDLLRTVNAQARIIFTVSPVPLAATACADQHVLTATTHSKAVLRVACSELVRQRSGVAYMPSYEIITGSPAQGQYFGPDLRSVNERGVAHVMRVFLRHFAGFELPAPAAGPAGSSASQPAPRESSAQPAGAEEAARHLGRMNAMAAINCDEDAIDEHVAARTAAIRQCNCCGGARFIPGPGGRMAADGSAPCCEQCHSLERGRAVCALLEAWPRSELTWRRALVLGRDRGVDPRWFERCDRIVPVDATDFRSALPAAANGSYDLISLIFSMEFVNDDQANFMALLRLLSPRGVLQICFIEPDLRQATEATGLETPGGLRHRYGKDIAQHFRCWELGLIVATRVGQDPCTGTRYQVHLFFRDPEEAVRLCPTPSPALQAS